MKTLSCLAPSVFSFFLLVVLAEIQGASGFVPLARVVLTAGRSFPPGAHTRRGKPPRPALHLPRRAFARPFPSPHDRLCWKSRSYARNRPLDALSSPDWVRESSDAVWQSDASGDDEDDEELVMEEDGITFRRADPERDIDDSSFDAVYSSVGADASAPRDYSIAQCTVPEICDAYGFCESYVAELLIHSGCQAPLDMERPIGDFMSGEQVHALLVALTSFDPASVNEEYYQDGIDSLAEDLGVSPEEVERVCRDEGIILPFGRASRLHGDAVQAVRRALELDEALVTAQGAGEEGGRTGRGFENDEDGYARGSGPAAQSQDMLERFALGEFDSP